MKWSYRIGRVAGTDVKVHVTFLLLLGFIALNDYARGGMAAALTGTGWILAVFGCVLLHEFGHIFMARHFGVRTPDVILLPIGGVARLERMPDEPRQEFLIALAGPAVTLAIAALFFAVLLVQGVTPPLGLTGIGGSPLVGLFQLNLLLLVFNLLPAFPMDGGRVLRAVLASRLGLARATRIAAAVGQFAAVLLGFLGLGFFGLPGNPILVLIAVFIFLGAASEASAVETRMAGRGVLVQQMMVTDFRTVPVWARLSDAVELLLSGEQREFPVVDNGGRVEGILTRDNLIRGLAAHGPGSSVSAAMTPAPPSVPLTLGFGEALERLRASGLPALPVTDGGGALVGMLTKDNITDLLLVRRAQGAG